MVAKAESVAFLDFVSTVFVVNVETKLVHQHESLLIADDDGFGVADENLVYRTRMVGLKMVDQQVVERTPFQHVVDVLKELPASRPINRVEKHGFLVKQEIAVVRHATRYRVDVLEQVQPVLVSADPVQIVCNRSDTMHFISS